MHICKITRFHDPILTISILLPQRSYAKSRSKKPCLKAINKKNFNVDLKVINFDIKVINFYL